MSKNLGLVAVFVLVFVVVVGAPNALAQFDTYYSSWKENQYWLSTIIYWSFNAIKHNRHTKL